MKRTKTEKGITLIALIITVIILLILAVVAIGAVQNDGIIQHAKNARDEYGKAQENEQGIIDGYLEDLENITLLPYFGKPYNMTIGSDLMSFVFYEDGSAKLYFNGVLGEQATAGTIIYGDGTVNVEGTIGSLSSDRKQIDMGNGTILVLGELPIIDGGSSEGEITLSDKTTGVSKLNTVTDNVWSKLNDVAKLISTNSDTITKDTETVGVNIDGINYTISAGDTFILTDTNANSYTVRVLGFNHDKLTNQDAYGGTNIYAGISFEFVDFLKIENSTTARMNENDTNSGGWGASELRAILNSDTVLNIFPEIVKTNIKTVNKDYIDVYNVAEVSDSPSQDKLWLLACSEIWADGDSENHYGYAKTSEGNRYKYYAMANNVYNETDQRTNIKPTGDGDFWWWLRSPMYDGSWLFCFVDIFGACYYNHANAASGGVAPGFCI